ATAPLSTAARRTVFARAGLLDKGQPRLQRDGYDRGSAGTTVDPALSSQKTHALVHGEQADTSLARGAHQRRLEIETAAVIGDRRLDAVPARRHGDLDLAGAGVLADVDRKSTRLNSSHQIIS